MDERSGKTFRQEAEARERQEQGLRELGAALREVIRPDRWATWDQKRRCRAVEDAHDLAREHMGIAHDTRVLWTDDPCERGYDVKIPYDDLAGECEQVAGVLAHEMRHAWQWDVIERRRDPPGGKRERDFLTDAYRQYDASNAFKYRNNELERDAQDRAAYVVEGFSD
jgi:hypothetical protein